jgi:ATP-dependent helicase IRC3
MIEENWLSDVIFTTVQTKADLTKIHPGANGDFQTSALSRAINTDETNEIVVKAWLEKAKERKSTLVFCVDLNHVSNLTAKFRQYGIPAQFVTGDTPKKIRSARVDAFKNGEIPVLLNCGVFTEGTDIPNIDCVLLARPTKSRNLLVQMIGRGMRLHKGKENCHIIDLVAALNTGVVSTPTLFGLDPAEIVENMDSKDMEELKERKEKEKRREEKLADITRNSRSRAVPGTLTFTDYDSVHDLIADNAGDQFIRRISEYAWVGVGDGKYVLTSNSGNYLIIEPSETDERFLAKWYRRLPASVKAKSPYATPRIIAEGESFEHVVHAADTYAADVFEHMWISKSQAWRRSPASQAQLNILNKSRAEDDKLEPNDLTKGKAGDMITRLKHGAKGRYTKASTKKRAEDRLKERADATKRRLQGQVRVGPLADQVSIS